MFYDLLSNLFDWLEFLLLKRAVKAHGLLEAKPLLTKAGVYVEIGKLLQPTACSVLIQLGLLRLQRFRSLPHRGVFAERDVQSFESLLFPTRTRLQAHACHRRGDDEPYGTTNPC